MAIFMIRFLLCNIFICIIIGILFTVKKLLKNILTSRMQYNLWFLLFGLLAIPFVPIQQKGSGAIFSWLDLSPDTAAAHADSAVTAATALNQSDAAAWMNDFSISVSQKTPSTVGLALCILWVAGIIAMLVLVMKSKKQLYTLKRSALPLQNEDVRRIYRSCLAEMNITKEIPIYSTAFFKSPVIVGLFEPCIYLPIHLLSGYRATDIRYMLLHELQHYKHKDVLGNYLMSIASIVYWFNPLIWYVRNEMRTDREVACDTSVLQMLGTEFYEDYGHTLINFAEKISLTPFSFASGISSSMAQMQKRILNIANYHPATLKKKLHSALSYTLIAIFMLSFVPALSIQAADQDRYHFNTKGQNISYLDLSTDFDGYEGSFVLYDLNADSWQIFNMDQATTRIAPASTYKIYIALAGLTSGVITPDQSLIPWNGQQNGFDTWNADQTLETAMQNSVNWYFQAIDQQIGFPAIRKYIQEISYGNRQVTGDVSSYWCNSSLKISPIEQVEMLRKLYDNDFHFSSDAIEAVKNSINLFSSNEGTFYGKTGTEAVDGVNVSGWFIGFVEKDENTYFFATNVQDQQSATGADATELTFSILSDFNLWKER